MKKYLSVAAVSLVVLCTACQPSNKSEKSENIQQTEATPNTLTESEKADGWKLLFDGKTTNGWRGVGKEAFPDCGWKIENGEIQVIKKADLNGQKSSDIVTIDQYQYFELSFEFKLTPGANSGVKYRVLESEKRKGFAFGPEYQVLDDAQHPDAKLFTSVEGSRTVAGLYDIIAPQEKVVKPVGEWNQAIVKVLPNKHVEHWLNGQKTIEYDWASDAFLEQVKGSKFIKDAYAEFGPFGTAEKGHILLQYHEDEVSFRNIKIKELK